MWLHTSELNPQRLHIRFFFAHADAAALTVAVAEASLVGQRRQHQ